ncbi:exoaminopeptidase [Phycisphaerae bacterium RAS1]|nr:exoaminopeptidase [Phycisphaerae bacterium RAS1]
MAISRVLREVLALPTAAFVEKAVYAYVERFCRKLGGVEIAYDRHGNLLAHYRHRPGPAAPLVFTAHTDHPGFCALNMDDARTLRAAFRGWVEPEYFVGTGVRFWSGGKWIKGKVAKIVRAAPIYGMIGRTGRPEEVLIRLQRPVESGAAGMWDLPDPFERDGCVHARGCDDLAGAASMLALLERLSKKRSAADVRCLFTRAEEVGFIGAIGAARDGTIPRELPIIAIETSKALVNAKIGDGPILRVGDKSSVFTPAVTQFCDLVGKELMQRKRSFAYQRKLMDGGTCESTAYVAYGYAATGMCVALGNYHNMDEKRGRIASEYVSLTDWQRMVDWFEALALDEKGYDPAGADMKAGLDQRFAQYEALLRT